MYRFLFLFSIVLLLTPACKENSERKARIDAFNSFNSVYRPMVLETKDAMADLKNMPKGSTMKQRGNVARSSIKKIQSIIKKVRLLPAKNKEMANIKKLAIAFHKTQVEVLEFAYKTYTTKDKKLAKQYSQKFIQKIKNQMRSTSLRLGKALDAYRNTLKRD